MTSHGWEHATGEFVKVYGRKVYKKTTDRGELLLASQDDSDASYPWMWEYWESEADWVEAGRSGQEGSSPAFLGDGTSTTLKLAQSEAEQWEQVLNYDRDAENHQCAPPCTDTPCECSRRTGTPESIIERLYADLAETERQLEQALQERDDAIDLADQLTRVVDWYTDNEDYF